MPKVGMILGSHFNLTFHFLKWNSLFHEVQALFSEVNQWFNA